MNCVRISRQFCAQVMIGFVAALLASLFFVSQVADAKPYQYEFQNKEGAGDEFNKIGELRDLIITFDYKITEDDFEVETNPTGIIDEIEKQDDNILIVSFKNYLTEDSFLDYTCAFTVDCQYLVTIPAHTLTEGGDGEPKLPIEDYVIPFKSSDIIPDFKTTFLESDSETINNNVLKSNAPRDIDITVPPIYMTNIETIHRYEGLVDHDDTHLQQVTNIDVEAVDAVDKILLTYKNENEDVVEEYSRTLSRGTKDGFDGFSTGQAGITAHEGNNNEGDLYQDAGVNEFQLDAYDAEGRHLETRSFKLRVRDEENDYIVNDYVETIPGYFGETFTLYELISDATILEDIITKIPVSELDRLGVLYANRNNEAKVATYEQLYLALQEEDNFTTIDFTDNIDTGRYDITVTEDKTLIGNGHTLTARKVTFGKGENTDIAVRQLNMDVADDVYIDVGEGGTAILDNVDVGDANIVIESAGNNSVHLNNVTADEVILNSENDTKVSISGESNFEFVVESDSKHIVTVFSEDVSVTVKDEGEIDLINIYTPSIELKGKENIKKFNESYRPIPEGDEPLTAEIKLTMEKGLDKVLHHKLITFEDGVTMYLGQVDVNWTLADASNDCVSWENNKLTVEKTCNENELEVTLEDKDKNYYEVTLHISLTENEE